MNVNISKTGVLTSQIIEPYMTLPDGSKWQLLLFHQVNKGTNLFTSSNCGYCNDYGLYSRLKWIDNFQYNNLYEFYVIQDGITHRWTQTNAPWTTTSVTGFTQISGTVRSGICKNKNFGALAISNTSPWWNLCGGYASYSIGGKTGIPGFGLADATGVCEDYLALYARIDNKKSFFENNVAQGENFYEY